MPPFFYTELSKSFLYEPIEEKNRMMRKIKKGSWTGLICGITAILLCLTASTYASSVCSLNMPADPVTMTVDSNEIKSCDEMPNLLPPDYAYVNATFSNVPEGYSIANGIYPGYCADLTGSILDKSLYGVSYQAKFWSSLDPNLPTALNTIPWDKINYIINKYPDESWLNLQPVIWSLVHSCNQPANSPYFECPPLLSAPYYFPLGTTNPNGPFGCPNSNPPLVDLNKIATFVSEANSFGANFVPTSGQKAAIVVEPTICTPSSICNRYLPFQILLIPVSCPCINIKKEISVDDGANWHDANSMNDDPPPVVTAPHGALYRLVVSNCGEVDLTEVKINDQTLGISDYPVGNLAAGASRILTSEAIKELKVDIACSDAGEFENVATVSAKAYGTTIEASDSALLLCGPPQGTHPSLSIEKTCSGSCSSWTHTRRVKTSCTSGCFYNFSATVTNTGDETITNITCKDEPDVALTGVQSSLVKGAFFTVTGKTTSPKDTLTCSGTGVSGTPVSISGSADCTLSNAKPAIDVKKYVSTDRMNWSDANYPPGIMVPLCSENTYCGWSHTRKSVDNSTVHTSCSGGSGYTSNCGKVYFKFVTRNTGNTTLTNISLTDSVYSLGNCTVPSTLNAGASFTCVIGPMDAQAGQHKDTATASGYNNGTKYQDTDNAFYYGYSKSTCR
jgi:hypothetical protein